jgi:Holliday junction resolvase-like predicted endonuclease
MPRISEAEYRAILARREVKESESASGAPAEIGSEALLHRQILDYCRGRGWIALHGAMAHRTHRTIGEPDFVILADGGRLVLVEAKGRNGKLSCEQNALHAWAAKLGHRIWVARSLQEFEACLSSADSDLSAKD